MAIIYDSKDTKKKVVLQTYYNLAGDYILFDSNPLHDTSYENVRVIVTKEVIHLTKMDIVINVIRIDGQDPIECEFIDYIEYDDTLILRLCQDWG